MNLGLVMNFRYAPRSSSPPDRAGVTSFVRSFVRHAEQKKLSCTLILFERDEDNWQFRTVRESQDFVCKAIVVPFSPKAPDDINAARFDAAIRLSGTCGSLIYSQSCVYAPYIRGHSAVFTNHGPFVADVQRAIGDAATEAAFGGGAEKIYHLGKMQQRGLAVIRSNPKFTLLEISPVQRHVLGAWGFESPKVRYLPPPIPALPESLPLSPELESWIEDKRSIRLFTACARLDVFKGLDEVLAASEILNQGPHSWSCLIIGGSDRDARAYAGKLQNELSHIASNVRVHPSLPPGELRTLFERIGTRIPFAFSSNYETIGLTPLQADRYGCKVFVKDDKRHLGAASLLADDDLYTDGAVGLADMISGFCQRSTDRSRDAVSSTEDAKRWDALFEALLRNLSSAGRGTEPGAFGKSPR